MVAGIREMEQVAIRHPVFNSYVPHPAHLDVSVNWRKAQVIDLCEVSNAWSM